MENVDMPDANSTRRRRKRHGNPDSWNKTAKKKARHSYDVQLIVSGEPKIACNHTEKDSFCFVWKLTPEDITEFCKFVHRGSGKNDRINCQYHICIVNDSPIIVCSKSFQSITLFSRKRLNLIATKLFAAAEVKDELGGNRLTLNHKKTTDSIIQFIQRFKVMPSHYSRAKSTRQYLSSELSIRKMWLMWKEEQEEAGEPIACYEKFRELFGTKFNLAFGHP